MVSQQVAGTEDKYIAAAMWAADNTDLMYEIMEDHPRIKTVRGTQAHVRIA